MSLSHYIGFSQEKSALVPKSFARAGRLQGANLNHIVPQGLLFYFYTSIGIPLGGQIFSEYVCDLFLI